jgi:hypothetical protein
MPIFVVESSFHEIEAGGRKSLGAVGVGPGSEKLYLHAVELAAKDLAKLGPRVDEDGNKQHDRLAQPGNEEWWIAVDGETSWPGTVGPKVRSRCQLDESGVPSPIPADDRELAELRRVKAIR